MKNYQKDYARLRPQMCDRKSREKKAERIIKLLSYHLGSDKLKNLNILDIGASTGIIDNYLADYFKKATGTDIDQKAIEFARKNSQKKNLEFKVEDAMNLSFKDNVFDIIICTHVYEHVPDPKKLFDHLTSLF